VLIIAYLTRQEPADPALKILRDAKRIFLSSPFVRHEVCSKAFFNKRHLEYRFYTEYFQQAVMFNDVRLILKRATREAARSGISAMDSRMSPRRTYLTRTNSSRPKSPGNPSAGRSS